MKKIIVAAAGLMLVGTMASTAMAEFKFSGDARARYYFQNNYPVAAGATLTDDDSHFNSRTRFKIEADTKGGAYVKSRVRLAEGEWDGTANTRNKNNNIYTDYAYIGVPFGPTTVEAGLMPLDITGWLLWDERADMAKIKYAMNDTNLQAFFSRVDETVSTDLDSNDGETLYGVVLNQKFAGDWALTAAGLYNNDDVNDPDATGFAGTVKVDGVVSTVALTAEMSYADEDLTATPDDGYGGYLLGTVPVGPASITAVVGFTQNGFAFDHSDFYNFAMLADYSQISTGHNFSEDGDSVFVSLNPNYKASEELTLGLIASYVNIDAQVNSQEDYDGYELGATASYAVTDGASLNGIIGYLDTDNDHGHEALGAGLSLEISF